MGALSPLSKVTKCQSKGINHISAKTLTISPQNIWIIVLQCTITAHPFLIFHHLWRAVESSTVHVEPLIAKVTRNTAFIPRLFAFLAGVISVCRWWGWRSTHLGCWCTEDSSVYPLVGTTSSMTLWSGAFSLFSSPKRVTHTSAVRLSPYLNCCILYNCPRPSAIVARDTRLQTHQEEVSDGLTGCWWR